MLVLLSDYLSRSLELELEDSLVVVVIAPSFGWAIAQRQAGRQERKKFFLEWDGMEWNGTLVIFGGGSGGNMYIMDGWMDGVMDKGKYMYK